MFKYLLPKLLVLKIASDLPNIITEIRLVRKLASRSSTSDMYLPKPSAPEGTGLARLICCDREYCGCFQNPTRGRESK